MPGNRSTEPLALLARYLGLEGRRHDPPRRGSLNHHAARLLSDRAGAPCRFPPTGMASLVYGLLPSLREGALSYFEHLG